MTSFSPPRELVLSQWTIQVRKGALPMAVLGALAEGPLYGLELLRRLAAVPLLVTTEGTIYPLLSRLASAGLLSTSWVDGGGHPRKYFELTDEGRLSLQEMQNVWSRMSASLDHQTVEEGSL